MADKLRQLLLHPAVLVGVTAFIAAILVQSGEIPINDAVRRLQTTHSFWTSAPAVLKEDYPAFGLVGRNGKLYGWYGMGQSLLMLPSDILGTWLEQRPLSLSISHHFDGIHNGVRQIVVSFTTNIAVCVFAVLMCFRFLRNLGFTVRESMAGSFALLFGTTFLHYTQNMMENNYILALTLTGLCFQHEWLCTGRTRSLLYGSLALGANLLTRLTTALDLAAVAVFVFLVLWLKGIRGSALWIRLRAYMRVALPCYAFFFAVDRLYQWYRFGSFFNTYLSVFAEQRKRLMPTLAPNFPWNGSMREGLLGPLLSPEKSIFLFDPLIVLTLLLNLLIWKEFHSAIKAYMIAGACLLAGYILFYSRYFEWSGGGYEWGDRYLSMPVQLLAMTSIPLLLRHQAGLKRALWRIGMGLATLAVIVQLSSVIFWVALEVEQMKTLGHPTFVIGLRFKNIVAVALDKQEAWSLTNIDTLRDPVHSGTPYFFPFLLYQKANDLVGVRILAELLIGCWFVALVGLCCLLFWIYRKMPERGFTGVSPPLRHPVLDKMATP